MLSSVSLEVSNSVSPELNWKKVTKGRRSRKPVGRSLNWGGKLKKQSPKRVGDFSGSDSDKFGEIASEQRCPDKVEHIPIKKRRHLLRTKSPSRVPFGQQGESVSPQSLATPTQSEELEMLYEHNHSSGHLHSDSYSGSQLAALKFCNGIRDSIAGLKFKEVANGSYYNPEDFSGIALLAAAACSNDMDDDTGTEKGVCFINTSSAHVEKDATPESKSECPDSLKTLSVIHGLDKEEKLREDLRSVSPKVDRLYWDLNTSMDSWEQPHADDVMGNAHDGGKKEKLEIDIREEKMVLDIHRRDSENCMHSAEMDRKFSPSVLNTDGNMSGPASCLNITSVKEEISDLNLGKDIGLLEATPIVDKGVFLHVDDNDTSHGDHAQDSIMGCATDSKCGYNEDRIRTFQMPDNKVLVRKITGIDISKILDVETSHSTNNSHSSTKCEDLYVSKVAVGDGLPLAGEVKLQDPIATASAASIAISVDSQVQFGPKEELTLLQGSSKIFKEEPESDDLASQSVKIGSFLEDCHKSDISHEGRGQTIGCEDMNGFQAGYDSPVEDGELRGSALCYWEENEVDGEDECVDYDSDGNGVYSDAADPNGSEVVEAVSEGSQGSEKKLSSASGGLETDFSKRSLKNLRVQSRRCDSDKTDTGGKKESDAGFGTTVQHHSADTSVEGNDVRKRRSFGFRWSYNDKFGLRTDRGKMQSHAEGPLYLDATDRKETILLQNHRPHSLGSYNRTERDVSPEKFMGKYRSTFHVRDRSAGDGHWGSWDSRNRYPSTYHGPESHGPLRRRSFADFTDRFGGMDSRGQRQSINYSSKDIQRPPGFRRRLSVDRDEYYDGPRRMLPGRGGIINRNCRGGSGSYSQKNTRGGFRQEGNNLPLPNDGDMSSVRIRHYFPRRDRSFSPPPGKSMPRRKSRSRSRSSSPRAWHSQRDWNMSMRRQQGRSPENRMVRMRVPFKKPSYGAEFGEGGGFVSPTRRHISPDRKSRWMDDQNCHLRHGRSPMGGMRRNHQRFDDAIGSGERFRSDDYCRSMMRTRRFPMMGGNGRVSKFENNYNNESRGEMVHRARHCDGVIGRRNEHDDVADDKFVEPGNSQNNEEIQCSSDQRDVQGGGTPREDNKRSFKIQQ